MNEWVHSSQFTVTPPRPDLLLSLLTPDSQGFRVSSSVMLTLTGSRATTTTTIQEL